MEESNSGARNLDSASPSPASNGGGTAGILRLPSIRFLQSPISSLLEYSGVLRAAQPDSAHSDARPLVPTPQNSSGHSSDSGPPESGTRGVDVDGSGSSDSGVRNGSGEVSIRIIGENGVDGGLGAEWSSARNDDVDGNGSGNSRDDDRNGDSSPHQRYIQHAARWIEQILPFTLLLLVVFIRQHLQGFVVIVYTTAVLFKSNDILRQQTALKGERKIAVLVGYSAIFMFHIFGIYWWHRKDDVLYSSIMIPPKAIPPFWHAVFVILINDIMVRQAAMIVKLVLLMYYKNGRGHNFRRQGQMLTLVEYTLLLHRALLPTPVWYRFFLNKKYGSLFSSLTTGLYLTFKLTSIVEKVQSFFAAMKSLSRKEVHYGSHASQEQVNAAGDLCAICQEKMHTPILLRCKHMFCEDCVSEWFERERTCPLCRALVRAADFQSYGDGSTSLFFQVF